jgi:phospholipase C
MSHRAPTFVRQRNPASAIAKLSAALILPLLLLGIAAPLYAQCTLNTASPSVTICSPANNATGLTSPVNVVAGTTDTNTVKLMQIYLDGVKVYEVSANSLNTNVTMSAATHRLTVQAYDTASQIFKSTIYITVSSSSPPPPPPPSSGLSNIKHIIFMVQENRSADNYFGVMSQYRASQGINDNAYDDFNPSILLPDYSGNATLSPFHFATVCHENLSPGWNESHYDVHGGKMDYFMKTTGSVPSTIDPQGTRAVGHYDWTDLPYYYDLGFKFATSDRWFSSVLAPTIPNRMYLFAATSFGNIRPVSPPSGGWTQPTIFDLLMQAGVSWRYYYQDNSTFLAQWSTWYKGGSGHVYSISNYFNDVNGTLPSVIFIERASQTGLDEHPLNNIQKGAADVAKIINALMNSPNWGSSVFILTFDEGGGLYDHVPPAPMPLPDNIAPIFKSGDIQATFNQSGFRVPLVVVSPWVKPHFVSHTVRDYTSILKLIETRFGLPSLTARDAAADNMTEFFDFSAPSYPTAPTVAPQTTNGTCSFSLEKAPGF